MSRRKDGSQKGHSLRVGWPVLSTWRAVRATSGTPPPISMGNFSVTFVSHSFLLAVRSALLPVLESHLA